MRRERVPSKTLAFLGIHFRQEGRRFVGFLLESMIVLALIQTLFQLLPKARIFRLGLISEDEEALTKTLLSAVREEEHFLRVVEISETEADKALHKGEMEAVLRIPAQASARLRAGETLDLDVVLGELSLPERQLLLSYLRTFVDVLNVAQRQTLVQWRNLRRTGHSETELEHVFPRALSAYAVRFITRGEALHALGTKTDYRRHAALSLVLIAVLIFIIRCSEQLANAWRKGLLPRMRDQRAGLGVYLLSAFFAQFVYAFFFALLALRGLCLATLNPFSTLVLGLYILLQTLFHGALALSLADWPRGTRVHAALAALLILFSPLLLPRYFWPAFLRLPIAFNSAAVIHGCLMGDAETDVVRLLPLFVLTLTLFCFRFRPWHVLRRVSGEGGSA